MPSPTFGAWVNFSMYSMSLDCRRYPTLTASHPSMPTFTPPSLVSTLNFGAPHTEILSRVPASIIVATVLLCTAVVLMTVSCSSTHDKPPCPAVGTKLRYTDSKCWMRSRNLRMACPTSARRRVQRSEYSRAQHALAVRYQTPERFLTTTVQLPRLRGCSGIWRRNTLPSYLRTTVRRDKPLSPL